ncbi:MAG: hypothetical protein ABSA53_18360 [Streptosporangiaceae bacterium]|jgi:hypothetical protein
MSIDQAGQAVPAVPAEAAAPLAPLAPPLRTLGDADAAVCADGFCEVPPAAATTGADE